VPGRNLLTACKVLLALFVLLLGADPALAYAGPGVDVSLIGYAMTLLAWVVAAFSAVLLWPVYALLRRIRGRKNESTTTSSTEAAPEEARAVSHTES
jgi:membrane protein implicated in regulation of membrane protease activity